MTDMNLADRINYHTHLLSRKEKQVASYLQKNSHTITTMTITELAKQTNTSMATITRLCKKLNYPNFSTFKLLLAQELAPTSKSIPTTFITDIISYYQTVLESAESLIHLELVEQLVQHISTAHKIILIGLGSSALSATEFKYRLLRMGLNVDVISDPHMMLMQIALLTRQDLLICITNSGTAKELIEACTLAHLHHIPLATLTTQSRSPITKLANYTLFTSSNKTDTSNSLMNSQLSLIFCIDCICHQLLLQDKFAQAHHKTLNTLYTTQTVYQQEK